MEGLKTADANLVVYVHPSKANNVTDAVLGELSSLLFKYNENFDGVLLAYDVVVRGNLAKILPGIHPYFGVKLKSKLLLFNPRPDMVLEGKVIKLSQQSIHIIVLGFSSAVIIEEDIRNEFKYKTKHGKGLYESAVEKQHKIKAGTVIRFTVKSFDEEILHISGSLLPPDTGSSSWLHANSVNMLQADSNTKKRVNEGRIEMMDLTEGVPNGERVSLNVDGQTKKSKRRKS